MKTLPHAPEGFFEAEAAGLRWLAEVEGGVPVPEVLAVDQRLPDPRAGSSRAEDARRGRRRVRPAAGRHPRRRRATAYGARPRRLHRPAAAAQQDRRLVAGVLRRAPGAALPQAGPRPRADLATTTPAAVEARGRPADRPASPRSRPPGCTATSGTATCLWGHDGARPRHRPRRARRPPRDRPGDAARCSACRTCRGCSTRTTRPRPLAEGWEDRARRCTSSSRCSCTPACSAAATAPAPARPSRPATPDARLSGDRSQAATGTVEP